MELKNADTGKSVSNRPVPPSVAQAVEILENLGDGEYLTLPQLATKIGCSNRTLREHAARPPLSEVRIDPGNHNHLYVSSKTKAAFDKEGENA
jgi:hypothetical protein